MRHIKDSDRDHCAIEWNVSSFCFGLQIWQVHSQGPSKQKPIKNLEKRERGRIQGLPKVLKYPLLSQERVKPRTSNLASTFTGSIQTKAH